MGPYIMFPAVRCAFSR